LPSTRACWIKLAFEFQTEAQTAAILGSGQREEQRYNGQAAPLDRLRQSITIYLIENTIVVPVSKWTLEGYEQTLAFPAGSAAAAA
jgi:hypothetical protein